MDIQDAIDIVYPTKTFSGADFQPSRDEVRLTGQLERVYRFMQNGHYWSLRDIALYTGAPESSASAQLRNLRKPQFGGHKIEKRHVGSGIYFYRLVIKSTH